MSNTEEAHEKGVENVAYQVGDIFHLPFSDATFDITYCHQVLCHLTDPKETMKEMIRVTKPGGIVAAREAIFEGIIVYPLTLPLVAWKDKLQRMHLAKGQHPDAGKTLNHWALQLGVDPERIRSSAGNFCYSGREQREWWGSVWEERSVSKEWEESMVGPGIATMEELRAISREWKKWQAKEEAWFGMMHGEILVWV
ncbi:hypothetical protein QFC22_003672 [Naganishia vaughanmartiniae]|uniref:Uncharacterized protein n=1 Tax=Naganishia vaughanmartiniae TaxID=1424756 RepID=A0ACC2X6F5_9TREE|nr:hypothetical protein QFC22_003672 [Naganishia vaughanmartiniae]